MKNKDGQPSLVKLAVGALRATKHTTPAQLPHWSSTSTVERMDEVRAALRSVIEADCTAPNKKGLPNTNALKRDFALDISMRLDQKSVVDSDLLDRAHRLAAIDMSDRSAFDAYVGLARIANADALHAARAALSSRVIVHLSCRARLDRARASCESFASLEARGISQVTIVGNDSTPVCHFDEATHVLTVPAPDSYEHLPAKVVAAMFFFALCGNIQTVLKVDDDHRLNDVAQLERGFAKVARKYPVQMGMRNNIGVLGNHVRVWHFGKCSDPTLNPRPFTLPGTTRWINGAKGYFVNRAALRLLFWSQIYFPDYIRLGLYEDMTISDLLERQGARLVDADMSRILKTVDQY